MQIVSRSVSDFAKQVIFTYGNRIISQNYTYELIGSRVVSFYVERLGGIDPDVTCRKIRVAHTDL